MEAVTVHCDLKEDGAGPPEDALLLVDPILLSDRIP